MAESYKYSYMRKNFYVNMIYTFMERINLQKRPKISSYDYIKQKEKDFADSLDEFWKYFKAGRPHVTIGAIIAGGASAYIAIADNNLDVKIAAIIALIASAGIVGSTVAHMYLH